MARPTQGFDTVGDGTGVDDTGKFFREEVALALRNKGMPLEGLRYPVTPTGMHYLLVHFDVPEVDPTSWRLHVGGLVGKTLSLSLDDLRARPTVSLPVTMECAGNGRAMMSPRPISQPWMNGEAIGNSEWTGTPLAPLLAEAGLDASAAQIVFTGADQGVQGEQVQFYQRSLSIAEATRPEVMLAYAMNGLPLEPQHGAPVRLLVPGWYGMTSVKWLVSIDAIAGEFEGFQQHCAYRYTDSEEEFGEPVSLIRARALMTPPGIPDFMTRTRLVEAGEITLSGRAWAGRSDISRVEVSADGGVTWHEARLDERLGDYSWRGWTWEWKATPGKHTLWVRATDSEGALQPDSHWNLQGVGNNMAQRVDVLVEERIG